MQITDNALSIVDHKKIVHYFKSEDPCWRFVRNVTYGTQPYHDQNSWGFACSIYDSGPAIGRNSAELIPNKFAYNLLKPLIIDESKLLRIRVGLIVNVGPEGPHTPHIDQPNLEHYTQIYYMTDGSAPTNIFEEYGPDPKYNEYKPEDFTLKFQCEPKANRVFMFDGYYWHSSSHVFGKEMRLAAAINYAK
jgi:hypothetical protein